MKKYILSLGTVLAFSAVSHAQIEKNVGDFTSLKASNRIKIELIPATENKVVLKESQEKSVNITNKNGRLILKNTVKELVGEEEYSVTVQVYFNDLKQIDAQGGSYIFSDAVLEQNTLDLSANLGSTLKLNLKTEKLDASANTGARLELKGLASTSVKFSATAGGQIRAEHLETARNKTTVNSGSTATITATDFVDVQVIAGGNIKIYGNPKDVKEKTSIGGTIERVK